MSPNRTACRNSLLLLWFALALSTAATASAHDGLKIGVVDTELLIVSSNPGQALRAELGRALEDAVVSFRRLQDDRQHEMDKMRSEGRREIEMRLMPVLLRIRDENGYGLFLDKRNPAVILPTDSIDITGWLIEQVNRVVTAD